MEVPPGEGERRAQRGYVPQYNLGATLIYEALAAGRLRWVGVADRGAGPFDDIVLGLTDRIEAYQVKTSRDPEPFSLHTLLLGAENLFGRMIDARRRIAASSTGLNTETVYACDDYPRTDDKLDADCSISSAAYLRAHDAHRLSWGLLEWRNSLYWPFVGNVQKHSALNDAEFELLWRNTRFETGRRGRLAGIENPTSEDRKRIGEIAALLPQLVADPADLDCWSVEQLLLRLHWSDPFGLRHGHTFPVDALYESNERTQRELSTSLAATTSGYISLTGPPGSGKSTLLAAGLLPPDPAHIVRYLAFVPGRGQGFGRGEAFDFLHDVIKQMKQHGLGKEIIPGSELPELRKQLEQLFLEASERFRAKNTRIIVVVDGLDHVPREEKPQYSFLRVLPVPDAIPEGIVFILGTQRLELEDIPKSVADQAREAGRQITIAPLDPAAIHRLADLAGVPKDVNRNDIYPRTAGHPLSARYIIDGLLRAPTAEKRKEWLRTGPEYGGDVDVFYKRAWHDLEGNAEAKHGMAYLALVEGSIRPTSLDLMIGPHATDVLWDAAGHLLRRDRANNWSVFHNSFRLFLRDQTSLRHGLPDQAQVQSRYIELAEMARSAEEGDGQRWLDLRYWARATQHDKVAVLAAPERFRKQFVEGRNPDDIEADIRLGFSAAKALRNAGLVLDLILASQELNMRAEALGDDFLSAHIYLGDLGTAKSVLNAARTRLTPGKGFELVEAFLEAGEPEEARELFEELEPIDKLLGSEELQMQLGNDGLEEWAEVALVFREPKQVVASIARLRTRDNPFHQDVDFDRYKESLKILAARGQLRRNPHLSLPELLASLEIRKPNDVIVFYLAAKSAFDSQNKELLLDRLDACRQRIAGLAPEQRRDLARMSFKAGRADFCRLFVDGVEAPTLARPQFTYNDVDLRSASRQVILHASLRSRLGLAISEGKKPESRLLATYQSKLEWLGRVFGESLLRPSQPPFSRGDLEDFVDFLERAQGDDQPDFDRGSVTRIMDEAIVVLVDTAALAGKESFLQFTELLDSRLKDAPGPLGVPSVRRAYAEAAFRHDRNATSAEKRINHRPGGEETPALAFSEAALAAQALTYVGLPDEARSVLRKIHNDGLGYSKRAKHDPQYLLWEDFFKRANDEDPSGRSHRVEFFARLVRGLTDTEGAGAAQRVVGTLLQEAAQAGSEIAASVADLSEECDLATWSHIVWALGLGTCKEQPSLAELTAITIGRLAVPFETELDREYLVDLVRSLPPNQLEGGIQRIVEILEVDAPLDNRVLSLESVVNAAAERGLDFGAAALKRWRAELPPPKSGSSPEDPYFNFRSLEEIAAQLAKDRDTSSAFGARSAFQKVAPQANYADAKALFEREKILNESEEVLDSFARLAIAKGRPGDAARVLPELKRLATERGSWGGSFGGKAKQRYFRLLRVLGDKNASAKAFDAFVEDLANGREFVNFLLPELGRLFELISPTVPWTVAWDRLAAHLAEFREYKRSHDLGGRQDFTNRGEHILADLLYRAVETTSGPLIAMSRTAAIEIAASDGGSAVLAILLLRLLHQGGAFALEAAQIAWECRSASEVKKHLEGLIPLMAAANDIAVRRVAMDLAQEWKMSVSEKRAQLPLTYSLALPSGLSLDKFEPPSGTSSSSTGLFTEDPATWTWVLERPLHIASEATELSLANLRYRAAQLMERSGGRNAFGPEAVKKQMSKLNRLSLRTWYRKLMSVAAFQSMREVVGELVAAKAIDPRAVPVIAVESGSYPPIIRTAPPAKRGAGIPSVSPPEIFSFHDREKWVESVADDLVLPLVQGFAVLASIAIHKRGFRDEGWRAEQYFGPFAEEEASSLALHLRHFAAALVFDEIHLLSGDASPGAVVYADPNIAGSISIRTPMLCPIIAAELGWRSDPSDAFTFLSREGQRVAHTVYWRDGGIRSDFTDHSIHRYGYLLLVRSNHWPHLARYVAKDYELRAWRRVQRSADDAPILRTARRKEAPPSSS